MTSFEENYANVQGNRLEIGNADVCEEKGTSGDTMTEIPMTTDRRKSGMTKKRRLVWEGR
jgi:hypothetical protein